VALHFPEESRSLVLHSNNVSAMTVKVGCSPTGARWNEHCVQLASSNARRITGKSRQPVHAAGEEY
jgi:hypothetical protein